MTEPTEGLVERVAKKPVRVRKINEHEYGLTPEAARAIIEEASDWISEQRTEDENHESFAAKAYVSSLLRAQAREDGDE